MFLLHKVDIVGADYLNVVLACQLNKHRIDLLLHDVGVAVAIGLVGLVALELDIVVVAKNALEPFHGLVRPFYVPAHNQLWNLPAQAGRADDKAFVIFLQHIVVDTRTIVETVGIGNGGQFAQRVVALLVLCQQDKVVAAGIHYALTSGLRVDFLDILIHVVERAAGTIGFGADNGFEDLFLQLLNLIFGLLLLLWRGPIVL